MGLQINKFTFHMTNAMIKRCIAEYLETPAGKKLNLSIDDVTMVDHPMTVNTYNEIINNLIDIVWTHIKYDTITTTGKGLYYFSRSSISFEMAYNPKTGLDAYVGFYTNDVKRPSLYPQRYPNGVKNIIKLFTTGYQAKKHVYGNWNSSHGVYNNVRSTLRREPNPFLEDAVKEFNRDYAGRAKARLLTEYMR